jgi:branched-chain amino acid transport system ATP-binding protein
MILQTIGLSKNFGRLAALYDVDLTVEYGEIFGIAGPNGAGKSTLFNVIAGAFPPSSGRVTFDGHDITKLLTHQICRLGLGRTFQIPKTFLSMSVYDNLWIGATFGSTTKGRTARGRVEKTLELLNLTHIKDQQANNLDLYTTKLVMLGAVLATECKLIMLDEPLGGLSITEIEEFLKVISRINQENGTTTIIIEHILDSLIEVSNRMLILHNGEVLYTGDPHGVRENDKVREVYLGREEGE